MINGYCDHPGLSALLEFESVRLGVPLKVRHADLQWDAAGTRDVLEVLVHDGGRPVDFGVHLDGDVHRFQAPLWLPPDDTPIFGPLDELGHVQPLVSLLGYRVAIHVPPRLLDDLTVKLLGPALEAALPLAKEAYEEEVLAKEIERFVEMKARTSQERLASLRLAEDEARRSGFRLEDDLRLQYRKLSETKAQIEALQKYTLTSVQRTAREEIQQLRKMVPTAFKSIRLDGEVLILETHELALEYEGESYYVGAFNIRLDLRHQQVLISSTDGRSVGGFCHPHVGSDQRPCLGNLSSPVADMLARMDVVGLAVSLKQLLESYNHENPFIDLRRWDEDWEDSERFESCFDLASTEECVSCNDDSCPYWDSRHDRCWDAVDDYVDCIRCEACGMAEEARRLCREQHTPDQCFDCDTTACDYAGDEDACHGVHGGSVCPDCNHEHCPRHPGEEDGDDP